MALLEQCEMRETRVLAVNGINTSQNRLFDLYIINKIESIT